MRFFLLLLGIIMSIASLQSQDYQADFIIANRDFFKKISPLDLVNVKISRTWVHAPQAPADNWAKKLHPGKNFTMPADNRIDLDKFFDKLPEKNKAITYLYTELTADKAGIAQIGIGADWWFEAACNGTIYCSTFNGGNGSGSFAPSNNPFFFPVKKGRNLLAVKVRRGGYTWNFTCGNVAYTPPPQVLAELAVGPWLTNPDTGAISVRFATAGKLHAGVEYREAGKPDTAKIQWDSVNGIIRNADFHSLHLKNLTPGKTYEYRVVLLNPRNRKQIVYPQKETFHTYRCPDEKLDKFSFLFVADLQFPPEKQHRIFRELLKIGDFASCNFIVFGGDLNSSFVKQEMLDGLFKIVSTSGGDTIPSVIVRGNHELTGPHPEVYNELFADPQGKTYGVFRYGSSAFLNLDSFSQNPYPERTGNTTGAEFMAEQAEFLKQALPTAKWEKAKRRFVISHSAPYSREDDADMCNMTRQLTDPFFAGKTPRSKLDLWLGAHIHRYTRGIPGSAQVTSYLPLDNKVTVTGENYTFPVITNAGPESGMAEKISVFRVDVEKDQFTVTAWLGDGKCLEKVIYYDNGEVKEILSLPRR